MTRTSTRWPDDTRPSQATGLRPSRVQESWFTRRLSLAGPERIVIVHVTGTHLRVAPSHTVDGSPASSTCRFPCEFSHPRDKGPRRFADGGFSDADARGIERTMKSTGERRVATNPSRVACKERCAAATPCCARSLSQ